MATFHQAEIGLTVPEKGASTEIIVRLLDGNVVILLDIGHERCYLKILMRSKEGSSSRIRYQEQPQSQDD
jgi:hypothetical protein